MGYMQLLVTVGGISFQQTQFWLQRPNHFLLNRYYQVWSRLPSLKLNQRGIRLTFSHAKFRIDASFPPKRPVMWETFPCHDVLTHERVTCKWMLRVANIPWQSVPTASGMLWLIQQDESYIRHGFPKAVTRLSLVYTMHLSSSQTTNYIFVFSGFTEYILPGQMAVCF